MILKSIQIDNFVSHKNTKLEFGKGITVITGENGSGKTSILNAILFALFEETRTGSKKDLKSLIRNGSTHAQCTLIFEEGLRDYRVTWYLNRKKGAYRAILELLPTMQILAEGPRNVVTEIEKILGISRDTALASIFVKQGEIDALINIKPAERKTLIGKLIGITALEKAWQSAREVIEKYELKIRHLELQLAQSAEIEAQLVHIHDVLDQLQRERDEKLAMHKSLDEARYKLDIELEQLERLQQETKLQATQQEYYKQQLNELAERIKNYEQRLHEIEHAQLEIQQLEQEVQYLDIVELYLQDQEQLHEYQGKLADVTEKLSELEKYQNILMANQEAHNRYIALNQEYESIQLEKRELEPKAREYMNLKTKLALLETELSQEYNDYEKLQHEVMQLFNTSVLDKNTKSEKLKMLNREVDEQYEKMLALERNIAAHRDRVKYLDTTKKSITTAKHCPVCKTELDPTHRLRVEAEIKNEIEINTNSLNKLILQKTAISKKIAELKQKIQALNSFEEQHYFNIKSKIQIKEKTLMTIASLSNTYNKLNALITREEEIKNQLKTLNASEEEYKKAVIVIDTIDVQALLKEKSRYEQEITRLNSQLSQTRAKVPFKITVLKKHELKDKHSLLNKLLGTIEEKSRYVAMLSNDRKKQQYIKMQLSKIQHALERNKFDVTLYIAKKQQREKLEQKYVRTFEELAKIDAEITIHQQQLKKAKAEQIRMLTIKQQIEKMKKFKYKVLERVRDAFGKDGLQRVLRAEYSKIIESYVGEYIDHFNLDINEIHIDDNFDISLITRNGNISIDELSGGEKVAVGIALRLAIANALSKKISTVTLDEPTTYLDTARRKELAEILNYAIKESSTLLPQLIIVTHHEELEDAADQRYEVYKVQGLSKVKLA